MSHRLGMLLLSLFSASSPSWAQELSAADVRASNIRTAAVALSGCLEAFSIHADEPIPYFGLGHFLQRQWNRGAAYLVTGVAVLGAESHFGGQVRERDFSFYPNLTSRSSYFKPSARGLSPRSFAFRSYEQLADQTYFYVRLIDAFDAYREYHERTSSTNRVSIDDEPIAGLLSSPFKASHVASPWLIIPVAMGGLATYLGSSSSRGLSGADEIVFLGSARTPRKATSLEAGLLAFRYTFVAAGEEMYFRGILQTELTERIGPTPALFLSSALFGAWHVPNNGVGSSILAGVGGCYFGYRYQRTGDLGEVIAQHFWMDAVARFIEFLRNPRTSRYLYSVTWSV